MSFSKLTSMGKFPGMPILIEPGALTQIDAIIQRLELKGRGVAVYDDDAYRALAPKPQVFRSVLFDNEQLYCDDQALFYLRKQSVEEGSFLIAIGGEAIQSVTKLVAAQAHMPYIAVPTCAFGTGIASRYADMGTPQGFTRACGATPAAVIADTALMAQADESITLGAVRELIDRAGMLARNQAIALAAGYEWDQETAALQVESIQAALKQVNTGLRRGSLEAYHCLCKALITCGLADNVSKLTCAYPARLHFLNEKPLKEVSSHE